MNKTLGSDSIDVLSGVAAIRVVRGRTSSKAARVARRTVPPLTATAWRSRGRVRAALPSPQNCFDAVFQSSPLQPDHLLTASELICRSFVTTSRSSSSWQKPSYRPLPEPVHPLYPFSFTMKMHVFAALLGAVVASLSAVSHATAASTPASARDSAATTAQGGVAGRVKNAA